MNLGNLAVYDENENVDSFWPQVRTTELNITISIFYYHTLEKF